MTQRLNKSDWIEQGLQTLASGGAGALRIGAMATALEVSRGSFYWHFRDVADFRSELLRSWQERTTDRVIHAIEAAPRPQRLRRLMQRAFAGTESPVTDGRHDARAAERVIRSWATQDAEVAEIVASVDAGRIAYISGLLAATGVETARASARAAFLYWAYLGREQMVYPDHASIAASAIDDISALFEA